MYSIAPKTRSIKASSPFSITEPSQSYLSLFPPPYTPFREICTEQQKRNILEVFHDEEPGSEIDPIVRQQSFIHEYVVWCAEAKECQGGHTIMLTLAHRVAGQRVRNRRGNSTLSAVPAGSLPVERHVIPPRVEISRAFSVKGDPVDLYS